MKEWNETYKTAAAVHEEREFLLISILFNLFYDFKSSP